MDPTEFRVMLKNATTHDLTDEQIGAILADIDGDGSGEISLNEYLNWMSDHRTDFNKYVIYIQQQLFAYIFNFCPSYLATIRPKKGKDGEAYQYIIIIHLLY